MVGECPWKGRATIKRISVVVSAGEHYGVFTGLTEKQSEGVLLLTLIPNRSGSYPNMVNAWRRGDADVLWREIHASYADYPGFGERLIEARNRVWIPKIESYLASGQTYFVIVGMGHLGGPEGLVRLLQARGYQVEQL